MGKELKNAEQYKAVNQSLGNFRRATRAEIKTAHEELEALGKSIGDIGKVSGVLNVVGVGIDVGIGVAENMENDAPASRIASDVLVDVGVSGLEIGVTTGVSTILSLAITGAAAGTAVPGIDNLVGLVVGLIGGIWLTYKVDIQEDDEGKTIRDKIKDEVYSWFMEG